MPLYQVCDRVIESAIDLSLPAARQQQADYRFVLMTGPPFTIAVSEPLQQVVTANGSIWMSLARHPSGYHFHFPSLADFFVSPDGCTIQCCAAPDTPRNTIEHLLLDQILPYVLSHNEHTVLHASAARHERGMIVFLGDSGWGKSTLTAALCQAGLPLITDDCLLLHETDEQVIGVGSYPGLRLWQDSLASLGELPDTPQYVAHYTSKQRLGLEDSTIQFCDQAVEVAHMYLLSDPGQASANDTVEFQPMTAREKVITLLEHSFRLDPTDRERNAREFEVLSRMVRNLAIFRLTYPRHYDMLPTVRDTILAHVGQANKTPQGKAHV